MRRRDIDARTRLRHPRPCRCSSTTRAPEPADATLPTIFTRDFTNAVAGREAETRGPCFKTAVVPDIGSTTPSRAALPVTAASAGATATSSTSSAAGSASQPRPARPHGFNQRRTISRRSQRCAGRERGLRFRWRMFSGPIFRLDDSSISSIARGDPAQSSLAHARRLTSPIDTLATAAIGTNYATTTVVRRVSLSSTRLVFVADVDEHTTGCRGTVILFAGQELRVKEPPPGRSTDLESAEPGAFSGTTESLLRIVGAHSALALAARRAPAPGSSGSRVRFCSCLRERKRSAFLWGWSPRSVGGLAHGRGLGSASSARRSAAWRLSECRSRS